MSRGAPTSLASARTDAFAAFVERPLLCRFSDAGGINPFRTLGRPASKKRQGTKSRGAGQRRGPVSGVLRPYRADRKGRVGSRNSNRPTTRIFFHAFRFDASAGRRRAGGGAHGCTDFRRRLRAQREGRRDPPRLPRRHPPFSTWCEAVGAIATPATPATVAAYLAALADLRLKVSTISRRAAAIAYAHKLASFEPPINESVKAVMRGVRRKLGTAQKGKAPATAAVVANSSSAFPIPFGQARQGADPDRLRRGVAAQRACRARTCRHRAWA